MAQENALIRNHGKNDIDIRAISARNTVIHSDREVK